MVNAQQVQGAADVILFSNTLWRMPLNLCADTAGYIQPLAQRSERTAQAMECQAIQPGSGAGLAVRNAWLSNAA
jgi:hypothetical protein